MVTDLSPYELTPTHRLTMSRTAFRRFKERIERDGRIIRPISFVEHEGTKYIVDGHHRVRVAKELGFTTVPAERVELPYLGYDTPDDLFAGGH